MASGMPGGCDLWMWDGAAEYEGLLLKLDEAAFSARIRQVKKGGASNAGLGRRLPASSSDAHREYTKRKFLAHFAGTAEGTLFEARIAAVQASADREFEYVVSGGFNALDEKQLEVLRTLSVQNAATLFQRHAS